MENLKLSFEEIENILLTEGMERLIDSFYENSLYVVEEDSYVFDCYFVDTTYKILNVDKTVHIIIEEYHTGELYVSLYDENECLESRYEFTQCQGYVTKCIFEGIYKSV